MIPLSRQVVVLVHGIGAFPLTLALLQKRLADRGFRTINWGYPSILRPIDAHAEQLNRLLARLEQNPTVDRVHLVGHSMGSIVCRAALVARPETVQKIGRFVMLAPPNRGSFVARWAGPIFGRFIPPVNELSDVPTSYVNRMAWPTGIETAVFTARYDHLVAAASSQMPEVRVAREFPGSHSFLVMRRDVAEAVAEFLVPPAESNADSDRQLIDVVQRRGT
ncbi:MAG: alpha/beta fold hydrolase [Planctomycetaceae bacterium]|nr:alpha/beta fold hydrolase [Planctomycetaceae bacterium]